MVPPPENPEPHPDHSSHPDRLDPPDPDRVREDLAELSRLVATGIEVNGQVLQVAASTWAIYGHASYDGEIIVGEYPDPGEASEVLRAAPHRDPDQDGKAPPRSSRRRPATSSRPIQPPA
jgi:hypothetical protein